MDYDDDDIINAVLGRDTDSVRFLLEQGTNPNIQNDEGYAPIILAIDQNNIDIVNLLLKAGVNPNELDAEGYTPLIQAVKKK